MSEFYQIEERESDLDIFNRVHAQAVRSDALEEAAEIADRLSLYYVENTPAHKVALDIAKQIRAKK